MKKVDRFLCWVLKKLLGWFIRKNCVVCGFKVDVLV